MGNDCMCAVHVVCRAADQSAVPHTTHAYSSGHALCVCQNTILTVADQMGEDLMLWVIFDTEYHTMLLKLLRGGASNTLPVHTQKSLT